MKHVFAVLLLSGASLHAQEATVPQVPATPMAPARQKFALMDIYGLATRDFRGGGVGMGVFAPAIPVVPYGAVLHLGGDFHFTGLDRRTMKDVPLMAPQTGHARVKLHESLFILNAVARLSAPWQYRVSPYVDGFVGLRLNTAGITVTPNDYQPGYESSTSDNLDMTAAFQYGGAAGVLIRLTDDIKLNAAVMYSRSEKPGMLSNIHSAGLNGTALMMDKKTLKSEMVFFKLGVTFRIDPSTAVKDNRDHDCNCCGQRRTAGSGIFAPSRSSGSGGAANRVGTGVRVSK